VYRGCSRRSSVSCGGPRKEGLEKFSAELGKVVDFFSRRGEQGHVFSSVQRWFAGNWHGLIVIGFYG
jgi:hypothetical protein